MLVGSAGKCGGQDMAFGLQVSCMRLGMVVAGYDMMLLPGCMALFSMAWDNEGVPRTVPAHHTSSTPCTQARRTLTACCNTSHCMTLLVAPCSSALQTLCTNARPLLLLLWCDDMHVPLRWSDWLLMQVQDALQEAEGVDAVLEAMRAHETDLNVQVPCDHSD